MRKEVDPWEIDHLQVGDAVFFECRNQLSDRVLINTSVEVLLHFRATHHASDKCDHEIYESCGIDRGKESSTAVDLREGDVGAHSDQLIQRGSLEGVAD